ncbi:vesicle transport v-SNARE 11-like protein, partial [Tanacetum coccineum]
NAKKRKTSHSNWKGKAAKEKSNHGSKRKAEYEIAPTSDPKEALCFYYNTKGHWKRSCLEYLKDLKDRKGLKESRRLKHGDLKLVMGSRKITLVARIGKLTISPNVEVSFFKLLCITDDIEDMTFNVYALPCYGLVLFVMALFIHAL